MPVLPRRHPGPPWRAPLRDRRGGLQGGRHCPARGARLRGPCPALGHRPQVPGGGGDDPARERRVPGRPHRRRDPGRQAQTRVCRRRHRLQRHPPQCRRDRAPRRHGRRHRDRAPGGGRDPADRGRGGGPATKRCPGDPVPDPVPGVRLRGGAAGRGGGGPLLRRAVLRGAAQGGDQALRRPPCHGRGRSWRQDRRAAGGQGAGEDTGGSVQPQRHPAGRPGADGAKVGPQSGGSHRCGAQHHVATLPVCPRHPRGGGGDGAEPGQPLPDPGCPACGVRGAAAGGGGRRRGGGQARLLLPAPAPQRGGAGGPAGRRHPLAGHREEGGKRSAVCRQDLRADRHPHPALAQRRQGGAAGARCQGGGIGVCQDGRAGGR